MNSKYDVYLLSCKGEICCDFFIGNLFRSLQRKRRCTLRDVERLEKGDSISPEAAIEQSLISIVVFSKNCADSTWYLEELAKISQEINKREYDVVPIFYDVDRSEVRYQNKSFEKAFSEHEKMFRSNLDKVQRWRRAFTQVANLSGGWDVVGDTLDREVIYAIVEEAFIKVRNKLPRSLVGMQSRVEALENLIDLGSHNIVRVVGICGMVGVGKTTLGRVVHDRIFYHFEAGGFITIVKELDKVKGFLSIQKNHTWLKILDDEEGTNLISTRFKDLKTLIVLDGVDDSKQLEKLVEKSEWFGPGSRIIIITRNEQILRKHGVNKIYKVELLNDDEALQLFCKQAFKNDYPPTYYQEMTNAALKWANGLPLAIVELGSNLLGRSAVEWTRALSRLENHPPESVMQVLKTSFDALEEEEKEIFLDIACFFVGDEVNYVMRTLRYCQFNPEKTYTLSAKSLIETDRIGRLMMHGLVKRMGWNIAQQHSPENPAKWSRIWLYLDFQLARSTGIMLPNLRSVDLRNSKDIRTISDISMMPNLERLNLEGCTNLRQLHPSIATLSKLKFLNLKNCTNLVSIPNKLFGSSSLGFLNLAGCSRLGECLDFDSWRSSLEEKVLGREDGTLLEMLPNLRSMDLRNTKDIRMMVADFSMMPNLETLNLEGCTGLRKLHPSIATLSKLKFLNLKNCISLRSIPNNLFGLSSLQFLNLAGCSELAEYLDFDSWSNEDVSLLEEMGKPGLKSKRKARNFPMGDAAEARGKASKVKKRYSESSSTGATSSYSIDKCVVDLNKMDSISNNSYMKALEKFKDPYWREVFLNMPYDRKKAWLDSLV